MVGVEHTGLHGLPGEAVVGTGHHSQCPHVLQGRSGCEAGSKLNQVCTWELVAGTVARTVHARALAGEGFS